MRWRFAIVVFLLAGISQLCGDEGLKSGSQVGDLLPGSFSPFNINGKFAGRYHCLVCENDFNPAVMVFAREPAEEKDEVLRDLMKKLDDTVQRYQNAQLGSFVVILSPAAKVTDSKEESTDKLIAQTAAWEALLEKLKPQAEGLKSTVLATFPREGPKGYKINIKAEVTVVIYDRYKVLANLVFSGGQFESSDVATIAKKVDELFGKQKKKDKKTKPLAA